MIGCCILGSSERGEDLPPGGRVLVLAPHTEPADTALLDASEEIGREKDVVELVLRALTAVRSLEPAVVERGMIRNVLEPCSAEKGSKRGSSLEVVEVAEDGDMLLARVRRRR